VNHDPVVGYIQGMNFVAAALLIILHPKNYQSFDQSRRKGAVLKLIKIL